jgi:hypothetical protein
VARGGVTLVVMCKDSLDSFSTHDQNLIAPCARKIDVAQEDVKNTNGGCRKDKNITSRLKSGNLILLHLKMG